MILNDDEARTFRTSLLPVQRALMEICPSPSWRLYKGWIPRQKNQRAARLGHGTRSGQALLKRLDGARKTDGSRR
jgi:hypothetical protein